MTRQTVHASGIVELLSPLSHGGDSNGTIRSLRREKIRQPDGRYEEVPIYSGNAFRGQLRDCGVLYLLERLGWDDGSLSPAAYYFLFSGGALSKEPGGGLDIDRARELRRLIPLVGVFGGAVGRQILRGKLRMGRMIPLCEETRDYVPAQYRENTRTVYEALQVLEYTRTDDARNEHLNRYLPPEQRKLLEGPQVAVTRDGDEVATGGAQQMRYGEETLAAGTRLWHQWYLEDVSDLELQAFVSALFVFAKLPFIGGNSRIGHGEVAIRYDQMLEIQPLAMLDSGDGTALSLRPGEAYNAWIDAHADEIGALAGSIP